MTSMWQIMSKSKSRTIHTIVPPIHVQCCWKSVEKCSQYHGQSSTLYVVQKRIWNFRMLNIKILPGHCVELHQLRAATCCRCTTSSSPSPMTWSCPSPSRWTPATTLRPSVVPAQVPRFKCLMLGSLRQSPPRVRRGPPRVLLFLSGSLQVLSAYVSDKR